MKQYRGIYRQHEAEGYRRVGETLHIRMKKEGILTYLRNVEGWMGLWSVNEVLEVIKSKRMKRLQMFVRQ